MNIDKHALKESVSDTVIATPLSLAINFVLINVAFYFQFGPVTTTLFITSVMFAFAIVRKYYVRIHFKKRFENVKS